MIDTFPLQQGIYLTNLEGGYYYLSPATRGTFTYLFHTVGKGLLWFISDAPIAEDYMRNILIVYGIHNQQLLLLKDVEVLSLFAPRWDNGKPSIKGVCKCHGFGER